MNYFYLRLYVYKVSSWSSQWLLRYVNGKVLPFTDPVTFSKSPPGLPWGTLGGFPLFSSRGHHMSRHVVRLFHKSGFFFSHFVLFSFFCLPLVQSPAFFLFYLSLLPALSSVSSVGCLSFFIVWAMYISIFVYCIYLGRCREIGRRRLKLPLLRKNLWQVGSIWLFMPVSYVFLFSMNEF